jgi:hypothetical protein
MVNFDLGVKSRRYPDNWTIVPSLPTCCHFFQILAGVLPKNWTVDDSRAQGCCQKKVLDANFFPLIVLLCSCIP